MAVVVVRVVLLIRQQVRVVAVPVFMQMEVPVVAPHRVPAAHLLEVQDQPHQPMEVVVEAPVLEEHRSMAAAVAAAVPAIVVRVTLAVCHCAAAEVAMEDLQQQVRALWEV